ncbi:MAG: MATE family multidrug resistance protein [Myxococcota bacterium]|jgi:MATE family multidrug resistance protein
MGKHYRTGKTMRQPTARSALRLIHRLMCSGSEWAGWAVIVGLCVGVGTTPQSSDVQRSLPSAHPLNTVPANPRTAVRRHPDPVNFAVDRTLGKRIITLAGPITIAMLTQTAINLIDTIMVGRLPSEWSIAGQSAIGISLILLWAIGGTISTMVAVGTQALCARRFGEGDARAAGAVFNNAALVAAVVSVIAMVGVLIALPYIFPWLHKSPQVVSLGIEYTTIRFIGMPSMVLTIVYKGFFDGVGQTTIHMKAAIAMNIANVILNYCLIFGIGPFPQMYVAGAALASLIATFIGLFLMIYYSVIERNRRQFGLYSGGLSKRVVASVVKVGIPGGLATFFLMTGFGAFIAIVGWLDMERLAVASRQLADYPGLAIGTFAMDPSVVWTADLHRRVLLDNPPIFTAATKVIMDIMSVVAISCIAFGQATATLVGQALGARDPKLAESFGWESAKIGGYFMGTVGLIIIAIPDAIAGVFNPDPTVVGAARDALRVMASGAGIIAVGMILMQSLFGAGETLYVMVVELVLHFFCLVPVAYLFGIYLDGGLLGIWGAALAYTALLTSAMVWKFRSGTWKDRRI